MCFPSFSPHLIVLKIRFNPADLSGIKIKILIRPQTSCKFLSINVRPNSTNVHGRSNQHHLTRSFCPILFAMINCCCLSLSHPLFCVFASIQTMYNIVTLLLPQPRSCHRPHTHIHIPFELRFTTTVCVFMIHRACLSISRLYNAYRSTLPSLRARARAHCTHSRNRAGGRILFVHFFHV